MTAKEFYKTENCSDSDKYDVSDVDDWIFSKNEMILFAEEYAKEKLMKFAKWHIEEPISKGDSKNFELRVDRFIDEEKY